MQPIVHAIVLCDQFHREPTTKKFTLLGIFDGINALEFPVTQEPLAFYIAMSGIRTKEDVTLRVVRFNEDDGSDKTIIETEVTISGPDPNTVLQIAGYLPPFDIEEPGQYYFHVFWEDESIGRHKFRVTQREP